ncbi:hypothetical protein POM88_016745 [Heracleum sosnowskyi]|uniref:BZIP domain-containing protein n=1 Tax=Heracleum sosnowskyi TaxID=360622 RepID=A0AAD8IMK7_9APIA|nr:hypothetical protein POM88_016745 [Heracleum sosnowskyi]
MLCGQLVCSFGKLMWACFQDETFQARARLGIGGNNLKTRPFEWLGVMNRWDVFSILKYSLKHHQPSSKSLNSVARREKRISMEEVWGNISLPSLHNPTPTTKSSNIGGFNGGAGTNFHDFFNIKDPYSDQPSLLMAHHPSPPILGLKPRNYPYDCIQSQNTQMASSSVSKKRPSSNSANNDDDSAGERRRKRLIKNRESADRSRARRLAYTNELEQEMEYLKKENASLRAQLEELKPRAHLEKVGISSTATSSTAAANKQLHSTKGNSLRRTLTALF